MSKIYQPPTGKTLDEMFSLQRALMKHYIELEDIPEYPLELSQRSNQRFIKSFAFRIIEELGEAYELLVAGYTAIQNNHGEEAQDYIEKYNEELADVWHFMLEILILSDIDEHGIRNWVERHIYDQPQFDGILSVSNLLGGLIVYSEWANQLDGKLHKRGDRNLFPIWPEPEVFTETPWNMGGRKISERELQESEQFMWNTTYRLTKAMNYLKSRDWHTASERQVNLIGYNEELIESFVMLIRYMNYTRKTELSIYNSYVMKNMINHERLKTP